MNTLTKTLTALTMGTALSLGAVSPALADDAPPAPKTYEPSPSRGGTVASTAWDIGLALGTLTYEVQHSGDFVQKDIDAIKGRYPDKNVLMIQDEAPQSYDLKGVEAKLPLHIGTNDFTAWVFSTGYVTNNGDLGWQNWGWSGSNWDRSEDQKTVTFH